MNANLKSNKTSRENKNRGIWFCGEINNIIPTRLSPLFMENSILFQNIQAIWAIPEVKIFKKKNTHIDNFFGYKAM